MPTLGIDLGTTNSACAIWLDGKTTLIPNRLSGFLTPSVVGIDDGGQLLVGETAKHRLVSHPTNTTSVFKRYMGSDREVKLGGKRFSSTELSSLVLKSLKEDAEAFLGEPVTAAVISVPAYFNDLQRKATKLAAELAGLTVERLINEPTAAAMVYGLHERKDGCQFMILDMGGGTFDVSVVEYFDGVLEVHASAGDNHLGGEDFLSAIADAYFAATGVDRNKLSLKELQQVFDQLEAAKISLSNQSEVSIEQAVSQQAEPWLLRREDLETICKPLLERVRKPIEKALRDANVHPADIDEIVLVGGATRMQVFKSLIAKMFRRLPAANIDPDLVVAMGAGIQAGLKEQDAALDDVVLTDVCPYTLGTEIVNDADSNGKQGGLYLPIIERNSIVPVSVERTLCTVQRNQRKLSVNIYQGEHRLVKQNVYLGTLDVSVPKGPAGQETIDVRYSYDMNGLLEVDVTVCSTGAVYHKTIINSPGELSAEDIEKSKAKLAKLKFHPRDHEENRALLAKLESLYESSLGETREYVSNLLTHFEKTLDSQNPQSIKRDAQELKEIIQQLDGNSLFT